MTVQSIALSQPQFSPEVERWRKFLRKDPTRFLLDAEANPSVFLWYLIDLANRPENSAAVTDARERVLYSTPVQEIFAVQTPEGYWASAESLAEPRYTATVWNLALLAELGIPRDSRRARAACEFALQNFLDDSGNFRRLNTVESGYLIHALAYFNLARDARVLNVARALIHSVESEGSDSARVAALWAWSDFRADAEIGDATMRVSESLLASIAVRPPSSFSPITFPPFDPDDALFILRVLAAHHCAADPRAAQLVEFVISKQNEWAQWPLEKSLNGLLSTRVEGEDSPSRWATLNAVRVIKELVLSVG